MEPDRRRWLLPLLGFLYLFPFPYFPVLRSPNEGARLYQARALVDDGTFAVNGPLRRYGPMGDLSVFQGRYFPNKAPGMSIAGAAVYAVAKAFVGWHAERITNETLLYLLRTSLSSLPTLLLLAALRRRLWRWTGDGVAADAAVLAYGLGSLAYTYGILYFSHQLCAVLLCGAWLRIETAHEEDRIAPMAWAGLLAGAAVLTEYTAALAALPLGLYAFGGLRPSPPGRPGDPPWNLGRRVRDLLVFGLASLPPQLALLVYHRLAYGGFLESGYRHNANRAFQAWHDQGFMGVTTPTLRGLVGSFFDPARGLFVFSPVLLLAPVGLWLLARSPERRRPALLLTGLFGLYTLFTASFIYDAWGWTVGPRHLAPLAAFLVVPVGVAIAAARARSVWTAGIATGLCLLSVVITSLATVVYPHYPEIFTNGLFELTLPLLRAGYLPRNALGLWFGVGRWCWSSYFSALGVALAWIGWESSGRAAERVIGVAVFVAGLVLLGNVGRGESPDKAAMVRFVEGGYLLP